MNRAMAWFAENSVAANLFMGIFIAGGLFMAGDIQQEVFPEITLDFVTVQVAYPGAGPEEVEDSICLAVEEAISGLNGIRRLFASASEGVGVIVAEVIPGYDVDLFVQDVKAEVDRIRTFPQDAERPIITKVVNRRHVISLVVYGELTEHTLREQAEAIRDELLTLEEITQVDLSDVRPYEISIEISESTLRQYNLTLEGVAAVVREASRDMPGGAVRAQGGEILLRTKERRYTGEEYAAITVLTRNDGLQVKLGDIADVRDAFRETDQSAQFDGMPAALLQVYRVGDQTPTEVSEAVRRYMAEKRRQIPPSVHLETWNDRSEILQSRMDLLIRNGLYGLVLVALTLGLFMNIGLSFWVMLGIPISFLGAMLFMPGMNLSINMMSLFAFILALGIVVDDAIVVGENIYAHRQMGKPRLQAAIDGVTEVSTAVIFAVLTSIAAFMPLLYVAGIMGKFIWVVPAIVMTVLTLSLFESLFILPAHLAHSGSGAAKSAFMRLLQKPHETFGPWLDRFIHGVFRRFIERTIRNRYTALAVCLAVLLIAVGVIGGGRVKFMFMPSVDADVVTANLEMPFGTPVSETIAMQEMLRKAALAVIDDYAQDIATGADGVVRNIYGAIGSITEESGPGGSSRTSGGHLAQIRVFLVPSEARNFRSTEFADRWRGAVGNLPGVERLTFDSNLMNVGKNIDLELAHQDFDVLIEAADQLKTILAGYAGVEDIADSYALGKRELKLRLKPEARTLNITESDLGRQVRGAFYGAEALRIQRGRNEIKVMVRYPEAERKSMGDIENLRIRTSDGGEIPLYRAADIEDSRGFSTISRRERKRIISVSANVDEDIANSGEILADLEAGALPELMANYPGLSYDMEGEQRDLADSMESLKTGFTLALFVIFALLAMLFRSYFQPLIVMSAIPFGFIGAVFGHMLMGFDLSILSMFGLVALTGVLVNDSLVLIDFINRKHREGLSPYDAVVEAAQRRFRPIVLTSLTTFFGLAPIILETSLQAQFLIPMAISLAFGVLFATGVTLVLVPSLYMILDDAKRLFRTAHTA